MRSTAVFLLAAIAAQAHAADTPGSPGCRVLDTSMNDTRDIACTFTPAQAGRRFRFEAHFSGGHDDTQATLQPLGDGPLACDAGSKTRLFGEDGDVHLTCAFSAPKDAATPFLVTVRWSHADYVRFALLAQ